MDTPPASDKTPEPSETGATRRIGASIDIVASTPSQRSFVVEEVAREIANSWRDTTRQPPSHDIAAIMAAAAVNAVLRVPNDLEESSALLFESLSGEPRERLGLANTYEGLAETGKERVRSLVFLARRGIASHARKKPKT